MQTSEPKLVAEAWEQRKEDAELIVIVYRVITNKGRIIAGWFDFVLRFGTL